MGRTLLLFALAAAACGDPEPIPGIGPAGEIRLLKDGFRFTEGPTWHDGDLFFTDINQGKLFRLDAEGELAVLLHPSRAANGTMRHASGELYACEMTGAVVALSADGKERRVLADRYEDKRFNAPNDLVIDRQGGVWFTDPRFGAPQPLPQGTEAVYYIAPDGTVTRAAADLPAPNGIILSPDEKTLYVVPSKSADILAWPVEGPGRLGERRVFASMAPADGGDGCSVDAKGNLYATTPRGVQVFEPGGRRLGIIELPQFPANCTFGGADRKTLYVTANKGVYAVPMEVPGHVFPAGAK